MVERPELKKRMQDELHQLKELRSPTEVDRGIAASLCYPRREQFEQNAVLDKRFTAKGKLALNIAVLGLMGNMISSSVDWFSLELDTDEDQDKIYGLKDWLEKLQKKMKKEFYEFGLYQAEQLALSDACAQGTSAMLVLDDVDSSKVRYKVIEPEEFYIREGENGEVDRFYREYKITAIDALDYFGDDNCPEIVKHYEDDPYSLHTIIHAIFPRKERDPFSLNVESKKYASVYYSETDDAIVKESGFDDFPVIVHRWVKDSSSAYGGCPAFDCIESLRIYNKAWSNKLKQDDLVTNPPMMIHSSMRGRFSNRPGAINYIDQVSADVNRPLYNGSNYQVMKDSLEMILQEIDAAFHTDYFRMLVDREKQMTAREVIEVLGERASILVPVVERLQKEVMAPLVKRHFKIMKEGKRLPDEIPPELSKKDIELEVTIQGPLSQAMKKYHEAEGIMRALEVAIPIKEQFPGSEDNIDVDELMRRAMDSTGMPQKIIREVRDCERVRAEKRKVLEEQAQREAQQAEAETYNKMKEAPAEGSPMQQFVNGSRQAASGAINSKRA